MAQNPTLFVIKGPSKAHSSQVYCSVISDNNFKINVLYGPLLNLFSDGGNLGFVTDIKKNHFVGDHLIIIHVQFGFNQIYSFSIFSNCAVVATLLAF